MCSLNKLRRGQESIAACRVGVKFKDKLLLGLVPLHPKIIKKPIAKSRRITATIWLVQENPLANGFVSHCLLKGHLPLSPTSLLFLLVLVIAVIHKWLFGALFISHHHQDLIFFINRNKQRERERGEEEGMEMICGVLGLYKLNGRI